LAYPNVTTSPSNKSNKEDKEWTVTLPTHLRYLTSSSSPQQSTNNLEIPSPSLFWACPNADAGLSMVRNPFDRKDLGFDGLFPPDTIYYHIPPAASAGGKLTQRLVVPVLEKEGAGWVSMATAAMVGVGFLWVLGRLVVGGKGEGRKGDGEKKKQ
jgi:hypothetical protein